MKLIVFADLHYYAGDRETAIFGKTKKLTQYAAPMLDQLIERVNGEYKPDAVINLGDSIQDANDHDADVASMKFVAEKQKEFQCPCYTVLGNHDMKMFDSHREAAEIFGYERFNYSLELGGYHLVFVTNAINPELSTAGGGILKTHTMAQEDLEWLRQDLQKAEKPVLIFTHYTLFDPATSSRLKNSEQVVEILRESGKVMAVFSGHTHAAYTREEQGIVNYVFASPIADLTECGTPDAVYYEVDVEGENIRITEHLFDVKL